MRELIEIAAESEDAGRVEGSGIVQRHGRLRSETIGDLPEHTFPGRKTQRLTTGDTEEHRGDQSVHSVSPESGETRAGHPQGSDPIGVEQFGEAKDPSVSESSWEEERERRIYRGRTVKMLRRYMRYSIETGRLPSVLGREFFRAPVTPYSFVTFEDRVIFVYDMETCLNKLDEFSREIVARHILQGA